MESDIVPLFWATIDGNLDKHTIKYNPYACVTVVLTSKGYPGSYEKGKEKSPGIDEAEKDLQTVVFPCGNSRREWKIILLMGTSASMFTSGTGIYPLLSREYIVQ
jgi:phosphoribosylamine--glycine ligase